MSLSPLTNAFITAGALGVACSILSVVVVLRRWAFIGEGISHAGFGGIGTAWLLSLAAPALGHTESVYAVAVLFCLLTAVGIGFVSRDYLDGDRVSSDAVIGIFMVASLAWGSLALSLYRRYHPVGGAASVDAYLFGDLTLVSQQLMLAGVCVSLAVILVVGLLWKEIIAYTFDPAMARVSGVSIGLIHFLLILLVTMVIVISMRLVGNVLMTALLVLPGATALLVSRNLKRVLGISVLVGVSGTIGGLALSATWLKAIPSGPAMVIVMFVEFVAAFASSRLKRSRA